MEEIQQRGRQESAGRGWTDVVKERRRRGGGLEGRSEHSHSLTHSLSPQSRIPEPTVRSPSKAGSASSRSSKARPLGRSHWRAREGFWLPGLFLGPWSPACVGQRWVPEAATSRILPHPHRPPTMPSRHVQNRALAASGSECSSRTLQSALERAPPSTDAGDSWRSMAVRAAKSTIIGLYYFILLCIHSGQPCACPST